MTLTLSAQYTATLSWNDTIKIGGIIVTGKGGGIGNTPADGYTFFGNAQNMDRLCIGSNGGALFLLGSVLTGNKNSRLGNTWDGSLFGGAGGTGGRGGNHCYSTSGGNGGASGNAGTPIGGYIGASGGNGGAGGTGGDYHDGQDNKYNPGIAGSAGSSSGCGYAGGSGGGGGSGSTWDGPTGSSGAQGQLPGTCVIYCNNLNSTEEGVII